jgi:hypothetical protein
MDHVQEGRENGGYILEEVLRQIYFAIEDGKGRRMRYNT